MWYRPVSSHMSPSKVIQHHPGGRQLLWPADQGPWAETQVGRVISHWFSFHHRHPHQNHTITINWQEPIQLHLWVEAVVQLHQEPGKQGAGPRRGSNAVRPRRAEALADRETGGVLHNRAFDGGGRRHCRRSRPPLHRHYPPGSLDLLQVAKMAIGDAMMKYLEGCSTLD